MRSSVETRAMPMIDNFLREFKRYYWKLFVLSILAAFWFTSVRYLGFFQPLAKSPDQAKIQQVKKVEPITPKLAVTDTFNLKKTSLISRHSEKEYNRAKAFTVINLDTGEVILEKNGSKRLPIASLTKVLSAMVALDLANSEEVFTVTEYAANIEPTKIGVIPGEKMTVGELLAAGILTSANDAMQVLADGVDEKYTKGTFVRAMNEKSVALGLAGSHFTNPQGFHDTNQYSTAEDVARFSAYALLNYPYIRELAKLDYKLLPKDGNHKIFDLYNWNGLLGVYPGTSGLKIGYTPEAGYTTVVVARRNEINVLAVLLGAPKTLERDLWAAGLLDDAFVIYGQKAQEITEDNLKAKYATWKFWN